MEDAQKIKPANWIYYILLPIIILSLLSGFIILLLGEYFFRYCFMVVMITAAVLHSIFLYKTKNPIYFIPLGFYLFAGLTFLSIILYKGLALIFAFIAGIFFIFLIYGLFSRKLKWRYREVLELAARSVDGVSNGFTHRPYPLGKRSYSKRDIYNFSKFLLKHTIAYPYYESQGIVIVVPSKMILHLLNIKKSYGDETFIRFNYDGQITVNIPVRDYQKYTKKLTFNQLCAAFGTLFLDFFNLYSHSESGQILHQMNRLRFVD
jgi:hypothetical protein